MQFKWQPSLIAASLATLFSSAYGADVDNTLADVVVTATRVPGAAANPAQDVSVVSRSRIEAAASTDLTSALSQEAGIESYNNGGPTTTSGIYLRGTKTSQTVMLVDGFRLMNPIDGSTPLDQVPLNALDRIEVVRGGASSLYGSGAIGGAIQLFTREPDRAPAFDGAVTVGRYGTYQTQAGYGGRQGNTSFYVGLGWDGADGYSTTKPQSSSYEADDDGYRRRNLVANLRQDFSNGHSLRLVAMETHDRTDYDSRPDVRPYMLGNTSLVGATYELPVTARWQAEFKLGQALYDYESKTGGPYVYAPKTRSQQASWLNHFSFDSGKLTLGVEFERQTVNGPGVDTYDKTQRNLHTLLAQWLGDYGKHHIQANVRSDSWTDYDNQTTGSLLYAYDLTKAWALTTSAGTAFRAPTLIDLYYPCSYGYCNNNPNLQPEKSHNFEIGTRYRQGADTVRLVAFRNSIHNDIELDANYVPQNYEALIKGFTATWEHAAEDWRWSTSYTHQDPKDVDTGNQLNRRAKNLASASLERRWGAWGLGGEFKTEGERYDRMSNKDSNRMGGYGTLNAYVTYAVSKDLSLQARVNNLTDKDYETAQYFNVPGRSLFLTLRYSPK